MSDSRRDEAARKLLETDWGNGLRLIEIEERPLDLKFRLRFRLADGQHMTLMLGVGPIVIRLGMSDEQIIREALASVN